MLEQQTPSTVDISPQLSLSTYQQEREQILAELDEEREKGRISFAESEHFIVVHAGRLNLGSWLDSDPIALAHFLEQKLELASVKFGINVPSEKFQVVRVKNGRVDEGGVHTRGHKKIFQKSHIHALFNGIQQRKATRNPSGMPNFYSLAVHEAIGHGFLMDNIFPQWNISDVTFPTLRSSTAEIDAYKQLQKKTRRIGFLTEGLSGNVEYEAEGLNPHDYFALELVTSVMTSFRGFRGGWKISDFKDPDFSSFASKKGFPALFSVDQAFSLNGAEESTRFISEMFNISAYNRGASFIEYMLDKFGKDAFRDWAKGVYQDNFISTLEAHTQMSQHDFELSWMEAVLSRISFENLLILKDRQIPGSDSSILTYSNADLDRVKEIYRANAGIWLS